MVVFENYDKIDLNELMKYILRLIERILPIWYGIRITLFMSNLESSDYVQDLLTLMNEHLLPPQSIFSTNSTTCQMLVKMIVKMILYTIDIAKTVNLLRSR